MKPLAWFLALLVMGCATASCAKVSPDAMNVPATVAASATAGQGTDDGSGPASETAAPTPTPTRQLAVALSSQHPITALLPTDSIDVTVTNGRLDGVTVTGPNGEVAGTLNGSTWQPSRNLLPQTDYTATIQATNDQGVAQQLTKKFSTLKTNIAGYDVLYQGFTTGVGMPATIQFVSAVETKAMRAEVEKHAKVTVVPAQEGSWGWLDNRQLMWRPKTYWKPGTKITVTTEFAGLQTGANKWLGRDDTAQLAIGDQRILYTDIAAHTLKVTQNGKTIRTFPVTNGKSGFTTRSGTKVIIERLSQVKMNSETVAIPKDSAEAYNLDVKWAMRVTWTGEFIHAAPWSVGSQGVANVSHGCTGMSTANAKWLFDFVRAGDLDIVTGSSRIMQPTDGVGVWQYSYAGWKQQSALN